MRLSVRVDVALLDCVDLGLTLDLQLTMKQHFDAVARGCFYHLHQLTLVHMFIVSQMDYCNTVLYGVTVCVIRRLQAVLHAAVRLISGVRLYDYITPKFCDMLHWLPVVECIGYRIVMMAFNCLFLGHMPRATQWRSIHQCTSQTSFSRPWDLIEPTEKGEFL